MSQPKRGIGRGLDAILALSQEGEREHELRQIPLDLITPNPHQPRQAFDQQSLQSLSDSLRERGVLQPVLVRRIADGRFELIAGERRWRAAKLAQLQQIPAIVHRNQDAGTLELALIENMAREDLNPVEQGRACAALVEELGLTREEVGRRVGRSRVSVSNLIRLLDLPEQALQLLQNRVLTEGHGRALLLAEDHVERRRLAQAAAAHGWSVRTLEARARAASKRRHADAAPADPTQHPFGADVEHPDRQEARAQIAETLESALRRPVTVRAHRDGSYRAELSFSSLSEAAELAADLAGGRAQGG